MNQIPTEASGRDHAWLQSLANHLPLQDVADLKGLAEQVSAGTRPSAATFVSATSRLFDFYIRRSFEGLACDVALAELEVIKAALDQRAQDLEPRAVPVTSPTAQPAPTPAPAPAVNVDTPAMADAIRLVYKLTVRREAADAEVEIWRTHFGNGLGFQDFLLGMYGGEEAKRQRLAERVDETTSNGEFVIDLFRVVKGRGCNAYELDAVRRRLESGGITRQALLAEFYAETIAEERSGAANAVHDGLSCWMMGTSRFLTLDEWKVKAKDKVGLAEARKSLDPKTPFTITGERKVRVSAIASLFKGGDFIEQFMDNITSQTIFDKYCELIIVDADSPEKEADTIARYLRKHPSINYQRMNSQIGIYEAWNVGVDLSRGEYLTNTNLDDLRRRDSLEIQAGALEALPFVDVVYQDFYYSFDPSLHWEEVAAFGYKSELPLVTPHNMLRLNSPHNAPMWRRTLHDELGKFDANFKSAGDYEFWLRCLVAGKRFHKINEPHVVYYQNPKGLSTRADTRGLVEAKEIGRKFTALLMPEALIRPFEQFVRDDIAAGFEPAAFPKRDRHVAVQKALRGAAKRYKTEGM